MKILLGGKGYFFVNLKIFFNSLFLYVIDMLKFKKEGNLISRNFIVI